MNNDNMEQITKTAALAPLGYVITGYWEKDNKPQSSWVAAIRGVTGTNLNLEFVNSHSIHWLSQKGDGRPCGKKRWVLADGFYQARIVANPNAKAEFFFFAVSNRQREDLPQDRIIDLLTDHTEGLPNE